MDIFIGITASIALIIIGYAIGYEMGAKSQKRFISMIKDENAHLRLTLTANKIRLYETQQQREQSYESESPKSQHYKH